MKKLNKLKYILFLLLFTIIDCNNNNDDNKNNNKIKENNPISNTDSSSGNNLQGNSPIYNHNANQQSFYLKPKNKLELCRDCNKYHPKCANCNDKEWDLPVEVLLNNQNIFPGKKLHLICKNTNTQFIPNPNKLNWTPPSYPAKAPVLYFYSKNKKRKCTLKFNINKERCINLSYPQYDPKIGWEFTCDSNSNILKFKDDKKLPFLYYTFLFPKNLIPEKYNKSGFIVKNHELIPFLREKLLKLGLNESEITHFILYWYEKLSKYKSVFIHFLVDDEVNNLLPMNKEIDPKPKENEITERRIMMLYDENIPNNFVPEQQLDNFKKIDRNKDIVIIEWGGIKITKPFSKL